MNPNSRRAAPVHLGAGERERSDLESENEVDGKESILTSEAPGTGGARRGAVNLSLGFIVFKLALRKEFIDALLDLSDRSVGISSLLTVCPGRNGQALVVGWAGLCVSVDPSSSYCYC